MLKITVVSTALGTTMKLEGVLNGASTDELESCWKILQTTGGKRLLCVDATDLLSVSLRGEELLDLMRQDGLVVVEGGNLTAAEVDRGWRNRVLH